MNIEMTNTMTIIHIYIKSRSKNKWEGNLQKEEKKFTEGKRKNWQEKCLKTFQNMGATLKVDLV